MDRSFLSDPEVVKASRDFVCVRLLTYESAEEAEFLTSLFRGRTGALENTVFTLLAPDGKTRLLRPGRTPKMVFGGSAAAQIREMGETLKQHAKAASPKAGDRGLPVVEGLREALNVAACDGLPLVILRGGEEAALAKLAWGEKWVGRFIYVKVPAEAALESVKGGAKEDTLLVVQSGTYGLDGSVLSSTSKAGELEAVLEKGLKAFKVEAKDERKHIEEGRRKGVKWESEIPDTDPGPPEPRK